MEEEINYDVMRYELDDNGYISNVFFGCSSGLCTAYEGNIPEGYETLEEWAENANIRAYKIVSGNLVFDESRNATLEAIYEEEAKDNSFVTHKEIEGIDATSSKDIKELYENKTATGDIISLEDGSTFTMNSIIINSLETITNKVTLSVTGLNMLPNELTTLTKDNVEFKQNNDRSISISGTTSNEIEVNLAGDSTSTDYILTFKKGVTYKLSGLIDNVSLKFYSYDGTDRELVLTTGNGNITFDTDKHITQITINVIPSTLNNIQVGDDLSEKTLIMSFPQDISSSWWNWENNGSTSLIESNTYRIRATYNIEYDARSIELVKLSDFSIVGVFYEEGNINLSSYELPTDFGMVTSINTNYVSWSDYIKVENEGGTTTLDGTIYPMMNIGETIKDYEPYDGSSYVVNLGEITFNNGGCITIEDGNVQIVGATLYPSNNIEEIQGLVPALTLTPTATLTPNKYQSPIEAIYPSENTFPGYTAMGDLDGIEMPATKYGKNTIYTHEQTNLSIEYVVSGSLKPSVIHLEGYTTINDGFSVDLEGNMSCNNATMKDAEIVGGNITLKEEAMGTTALMIESADESEQDYSCYLRSHGIACQVLGSPYKEFTADINFGFFHFESHGSYLELDHSLDDTEYHELMYKIGDREIIKANYTGVTLYNGSLEELKKNINPYDEGIELIKNTDIYTYNYKNEEDDYKKHIGVVIGDKYNTPTEILNNDDTGVDTYSMVSVCFNAIKQLNKRIEELENKLKESEINGKN